MVNLNIPITITKNGLLKNQDEKKAINEFVEAIITAKMFDTPADPDFGFILNNLRFEIFNENEGVILNSGETGEGVAVEGLYDKKVSGTSKNINTFAADLKEKVTQYETRLEDTNVSMTYIREERQIYITVKGTVKSTKEPYSYTHVTRVWN